MGRHWINPVVRKPLNLNISALFLNENNGEFANLLGMSLIDHGIKKRANSFLEWPPHLLTAGRQERRGMKGGV
jgi:hypothetical protein